MCFLTGYLYNRSLRTFISKPFVISLAHTHQEIFTSKISFSVCTIYIFQKEVLLVFFSRPVVLVFLIRKAFHEEFFHRPVHVAAHIFQVVIFVGIDLENKRYFYQQFAGHILRYIQWEEVGHFPTSAEKCLTTHIIIPHRIYLLIIFYFDFEQRQTNSCKMSPYFA